MCKKQENNTVVERERGKPIYAASIEDALTATGFGKYNYGLLLVCSWTLQAMGMDLFGSSFVVAASVCDLQLTMQQRALLTATPLFGVVLGAPVWSYISDTKGRRLTLVLSMAVGFVFAALGSLAPDWKTMAVFKLISSTFTSASNSNAYTLLGESCPERSRSRSMLLGTCALMCAQALSAVFAYPILPLDFSYHIEFLGIYYHSWRLLALVISLPCAVTACLLLTFYESPKFLIQSGRYDEAMDCLRAIYACNSGKSPDTFPITKLILEEKDLNKVEGSFFKVLWQQTVTMFSKPLLKVSLKLFYLVIIIYATGSGFILWLPYVMNNLFSVLEAGGGQGLNLCSVIRLSTVNTASINSTMSTEICDATIQETTLFSAMMYGAMASSTNLVISLTCGRRKRFAMMAILATSAAAAVLQNLVAIPIAGAFFFFLFLMSALSMGILSVYFVELYPTSLRGTAACLSIMLGRSSAFAGVNVIGALLSVNCEATFYVWSVLLLSTVAFTWFLPRDQNPRK